MEKQFLDNRGSYAEVIEQLADVLEKNSVPYEAATTMFGMMTKMMVDKAIQNGAEVKDALSQYMGQFMAGMGGQIMVVGPDEQATPSTFVPPGHMLQ